MPLEGLLISGLAVVKPTVSRGINRNVLDPTGFNTAHPAAMCLLMSNQ